MMFARSRRLAGLGALLATLAACGGGSGSTATYQVGGTVTGLPSGTSVALALGSSTTTTLSANGNFSFATGFASGASYAVTVQTQPTGGVCSVTNGTGSVQGADVTNVAVSCQPTYTVGGTVAGLPSGATLALSLSGGSPMTLSANGGYTFGTALVAGASYAVTVQTQPTSANCTVSGGSGTVGAANVSNANVQCASTAVTGATSGSTAFGVLSTGSQRVAFVPVNAGAQSGVMPVNLGALAAPASASGRSQASLVRPAAASGLSFISLQLGTSTGPDACTIDSAALKAVCIGLQSTTVGILDLSTFASTGNTSDIVTSVVTLSDLPATTTTFSGDSCVTCGVVAIPNPSTPSAGVFVVAGHDGYHVYSYPTSAGVTALTASKVYNVPISENLSVDPTRDWIIAPGYSPVASASGRVLNIIDLGKQTVYAWSQPTDSCTGETVAAQQTLCSSFQYQEIDSSSVDPVTGLLTLQSESGRQLLQVDMSQAVFTAPASGATAGSFTAPHQFADTGLTNAGVYAELSGVLASGSGDYLYVASEFDVDARIGVAALPSAGGSGGAFPAYTLAPVYTDLTQVLAAQTTPACSSFAGGDDPHRQATTASVAGRPFAVYASSNGTCLALVDMAGLAAAPHTVNPNLVDTGYDLVAHGVVQFVPVTLPTGVTPAQVSSGERGRMR